MVVVIFVALDVKEALEEKEEFDRVKDRYPPINQSSSETIDLDYNETLAKIIAKAIDMGTLQKRSKAGEEFSYAPVEQIPYTGWTKRMYDDGKLGDLKQYKDGKPDGAYYNYWQSNGQKWIEGNFKDGKEVGIWVFYNKDGTVSSRHTYKDGEIVED